MKVVEIVHDDTLLLRYACELWEYPIPGFLADDRARELSRVLYGHEYALRFEYLPPKSEPFGDTGYVLSTPLTVYPTSTQQGQPYRTEQPLPIVLDWRCFVSP